MTILHHAVKINAARHRVYEALTDLQEMSKWHSGEVEGSIVLDGTLTLIPKPGMRFGWRTEYLEQDVLITQRCVEGAGTSAGKLLTFRLSDGNDGLTLVELSDGDWMADDPHLPFCNTHWGEVLMRLKHYVEQN